MFNFLYIRCVIFKYAFNGYLINFTYNFDPQNVILAKKKQYIIKLWKNCSCMLLERCIFVLTRLQGSLFDQLSFIF